MQQPALDLDLTALPPEARAQFNEHLACLAKLCREHQLGAKQVGQAVTKAVTKGWGGVPAMAQRKKCEGCGLKQPNYGLPAEGRRRWCSGCAAAEGRGAVRLDKQKKIGEGCGL